MGPTNRQVKPPGKKACVESTPAASNKRDRVPSTPESEPGASLASQSSVRVSRDEIIAIVDTAMAAAMETARSKLREDMTALIQARMQQVQQSVEELRTACQVRDEKIEGLQHQMSVLVDEVDDLKAKLGGQTESVNELQKRNETLSRRCNDIEQWTRKTAIRAFGIPRQPREDCIKQVHDVITQKLGIRDLPITAIEVAHRVGPSRNNRPPAIIAKFVRRDERDRVLRARSALKGSGISLSEDLTADNQRLLARVKNHTDIESSWSWNGKIFGRIDQRAVQFKVGDNIDSIIVNNSVTSEG